MSDFQINDHSLVLICPNPGLRIIGEVKVQCANNLIILNRLQRVMEVGRLFSVQEEDCQTQILFLSNDNTQPHLLD